jgi:hypothetical protein
MGIRDQRAADGQHLLLAARELVAHVLPALGQPRKEREHLLRGPGIAAPERFCAKASRCSRTLRFGKICRPLGHQRDAEARDAVGRQPFDALGRENRCSLERRGSTHDRAHRRGLAHAVAAEQRAHFTGRTSSAILKRTWLEP